ncbi:extracellular solute-binding protein [Cellulomonas sp. PhB143]|uniref:extracellular solute-binding protein n=1 Tax=Cellulomonas sp. PhB143 TaxID=2485186 RepID=UPI000FAD3526|nr:extracellular solute-binding protein [Cellulomonas sp. PhB143]ROS79155.1 carbohydrate ABC transporter substrate-binding protein (CUT1 family) [Cellulomonas sp. PhB143]
MMTEHDKGVPTGRRRAGRMPAARRDPAGGTASGPGSPGLSRRRLLQAALVGAGGIALGGSLAGCATEPAAGKGKTSVTVWDLFTGSDGANMQKMVSAVSKANTDLYVDSVTLAWGAPYYTKLAMASSGGGKPPEAAIMHMSRLAGYAPGGLLEPFDLDALAALGVRKEDFTPAVWQKAQFDGQLYALPLDTHPYISFFNPAVAEAAGLTVTDGKLAISGADDFLDAGRAMAKATGDTGVSFGYLRDAASCWRMFWGLYNQTGGGYELTPGRSAQLDEKAATGVFEFLQEMLDGKIAARDQDGGAAEGRFMTKRTGMFFSGEWELPTLQSALPDVSAMPMPTIFGTPATYADSHSFVLPKQSSPDPEKRAATYRVLAGLIKQGLTWAHAGHIPAYQPIVSSDAYQDLTPQKIYAPAAETAVFDPNVWFTGAGSDFQNRIGDSMAETLSGKATPKTAVDRMLSEMNRFLSQPNPA